MSRRNTGGDHRSPPFYVKPGGCGQGLADIRGPAKDASHEPQLGQRAPKMQPNLA